MDQMANCLMAYTKFIYIPLLLIVTECNLIHSHIDMAQILLARQYSFVKVYELLPHAHLDIRHSDLNHPRNHGYIICDIFSIF